MRSAVVDDGASLACPSCGMPIPGVTENAQLVVVCSGYGQSYRVVNDWEFKLHQPGGQVPPADNGDES
jgi:hypothetical protein